MTNSEMREHTKELYDSIVRIFKSKSTLQLAIYENIFDDEYIKVFILLLSYFKLADVPNEVLEYCLDCKDIPERTYKAFFQYCQNKWLNNAYLDVRNVIKEFEEGKI